MTKIAAIKWDIRCKATSIANDFVNQPLEPVFVIGLGRVVFNPEYYPSDFNTNLPVAYIRLSDSFAGALSSLAVAGYNFSETLSIKFNNRVMLDSPANSALRVNTIQISKF